MSAREVATWHPIPSALTSSPLHFHRSPLVSAAPDKVDRLEARTALLLAEPAARPEAAVAAPGAQQAAVAAAAEPAAQQAAVAVGAEPAAQQAAVVVAVPDAQPEAVVAVAPDAQPEAVVAVAPDAQPEAVVVAVAPDAQREAVVAVVSDAQRAAVAVAASDVQREAVVAPVAETAVVRLWIPALMFSALALEPAVVPAAKEQAAADRRPVACRLLTAAVVH